MNETFKRIRLGISEGKGVGKQKAITENFGKVGEGVHHFNTQRQCIFVAKPQTQLKKYTNNLYRNTDHIIRL